jgi:hypothetical protein
LAVLNYTYYLFGIQIKQITIVLFKAKPLSKNGDLIPEKNHAIWGIYDKKSINRFN